MESPIEYVLPSDVYLESVTQVNPTLLGDLVYTPEDYLIGRPHSRESTKLVDADTAELLNMFRSPRSIPQAVIEFAQNKALVPETVLQDTYAVFTVLVRSDFLIPYNSPKAVAIESTFQPGDVIDVYEIKKIVQLFEDTEIYQVQEGDRMACLKIVRSHQDNYSTALLEREIAILKYLKGSGIAPSLRSSGSHNSQTYVVLTWKNGHTADEKANLLRTSSQEALITLCKTILEQYAALHAQNIIHGDVHPRNVICEQDDTITIVDFGYSAALEGAGVALPHPRRAGIFQFFEPEYARAKLAQQKSPRSTYRSEQYSIAALLYFLITGSHYIDFPIDQDKLYQAINTEPPIPFRERRIFGMEAIEKVLFKALHKNPEARFQHTQDFLQAFTEAQSAFQHYKNRQEASHMSRFQELFGIESTYLAQELPTAPICSVTYGAAGIAYAYYRMAQTMQDSHYLHLADLWSVHAEHRSLMPYAFISKKRDLDEGMFDSNTPYHGLSGLHWVAALIAKAVGDPHRLEIHLKHFYEASLGDNAIDDLTLGQSGQLLATASLMNAIGPHPILQELGERKYQVLLAKINAHNDLTSALHALNDVGIAHGWSGILYALLLWEQVTGKPTDPKLSTMGLALGEYFDLYLFKEAVTTSRPKAIANINSSWCNGTAGLSFLFVALYRATQKEEFLNTAKQSAMAAYQHKSDYPSLCCGLVGRAYAQLALYKATGGSQWLQQAKALVQRSRDYESIVDYGLFKGIAGRALLEYDINYPEHAIFPLFELEFSGHQIPAAL
ncbi:MAG: lanthionine synthetase LanC family protein [Bacteroidota bacterium]